MKKITSLLALVAILFTSTTFGAESIASKTDRLEKEINELKKILYSHKRGWSSPVLSSPYIGLRSKYDGSDLITNLPSINEDMRLLQQKQLFHRTYAKHGLSLPEEPLIELSGKLEATAYTSDPFEGDSSHGIELNTVELDVTTHAHEWITGFMALNYDSSPSFLNRNRAANSKLFLNKGFITLGNLNYSPYYASVGQMVVPFGRYSSAMISSSLPSLLGRTRVRALNFGYHHPMGLYSQTYIFNGNMATHEIDYGFNVGFEGTLDSGVSVNVAAGMLSDIADSDGMQSNGNPLLTPSNPTVFSGFGHHSATSVSKLEHAVPAANLHGRLSIGDWNFIGEYVYAVRQFDARDLVVNNHSAQPSAMQLEAVYQFDLFNHTSRLGISYQKAKDTLALAIPETRYATTLSTSFFRNTIQALEFRHDKMYGRNDTAFGRGFGPDSLPANGSTLLTAVMPGVAGRVSNMIILETGVYF